MGIFGGFVRLLQNFGRNPSTPTAVNEDGDIGAELPIGRNGYAANTADYEDMVLTVDPNGHYKTRICPASVKVVRKFSSAISKLDWQVRGGNPARAKWFMERFEDAIGFPDLVDYLCWAWFEGARYYQLKPAKARKGMSVSWDFRGGGRMKEKAGGTIHNDGTALYQVEAATIDGRRPAAVIPDGEFLQFRPGGGSNPEGETYIGAAVANLTVAWWDGFFNAKRYGKVYGIPITLIEAQVGRVNTSSFASAMSERGRNLRAAQAAGTGGVVTMASGDKARILQATPGSLADLWLHLEKITSLIEQFLLQNTLTSSTSNSGPVGSSTMQKGEQSDAVLVGAMQIACAINEYAVPKLVEWNDGFPDLPPLADGEEECYFWPEPSKLTDAGEVNPSDPSQSSTPDTASAAAPKAANNATVGAKQADNPSVSRMATIKETLRTLLQS